MEIPVPHMHGLASKQVVDWVERIILLLAQVLAEILWVGHVLDDFVLDGEVGSLHGVVLVKSSLDLGWGSAECEER